MKKILIVLITLFFVIGGGFLLFGPKDTKVGKSFTASEVASHNAASDCWTIIHSEVYDVTKYVQLHPGGEEIIRACGNDATVLFESRTTKDGQKIGSGTAHSEAAKAQLGQFIIGSVK